MWILSAKQCLIFFFFLVEQRIWLISSFSFFVFFFLLPFLPPPSPLSSLPHTLPFVPFLPLSLSEGFSLFLSFFLYYSFIFLTLEAKIQSNLIARLKSVIKIKHFILSAEIIEFLIRLFLRTQKQTVWTLGGLLETSPFFPQENTLS